MLTYNRARFIGEAISSVLSQDYQNWELFIIDDGSTDNTEKLVSRFTDKRIKYIKHVQNAGLFARRQESLSYPKTSKYTAILDSDDIWIESSKLSKQINFLEKNLDHVMVGTQTKIIDGTGNKLSQSSFSLLDSDIRKRILIRNQFTHSSILIRNEALKKTTGYKSTLAEDLDLILQLGQFGLMANLPHYSTAYRVHQNSENDRGIKMAKAVKNIIFNYTDKYPNAFIAKIFCNLRIIKALL